MNFLEMNEKVYVADTHLLIWYLTKNKKLSSAGLEIFAAAERGEARIYVSSISIAETYAEIKAKPYIRIIEFSGDEVLEFDALSAIPEMHDRIIVGLAKRLGAPLITADEKIVAAGVVPAVQIVW